MFNPSFTYENPTASQFSYYPPPPPASSSNHHPPPGLNPIPFQQSHLPFGHHDPNAPHPISYPPLTTMVSLNDANYMWNANWTNQDPSFMYHQTNVISGESTSAVTEFPGMVSGPDIARFANEMGSAQVGSTSVVANGEEMGIASGKVVKNGVPAGYPKVCVMCNVTCHGPEVYKMHLAGRKHTAKANLMHRGKMNSAPKIQSKFNGKVKKDANGGKFPVSVWCQYCNIFSNSQDAYAKHIVGKKHQRNMVQLTNIDTVPTANVPLGASNPQTGHSSLPDDLEAKKQKVITAGAAASEVRTCIDCNTVSNSQIAFNIHLAGQKHAAMLAKRVAESGV